MIAHRYKKWTDLQNSCKQMFNCINSLLVVLPAVSHNNLKVFSISDLWEVLLPTMYLAAENLLDMIYYNSPIENSFVNDLNKWFTDPQIRRAAASLKHNQPIDNASSIDLRFFKDFIFRSLQCFATLDKWEKLLSIAMKFNMMTR